MKTLTIDIGGTGIKMIPLDAKGKPLAERHRELTPDPSHPDAVLKVIRGMLRDKKGHGRISVGFPGVVVDGVVRTAANLGTKAWRGFDLQSAISTMTDLPTRVVNDADLQGYGVVEGKGVELALTLGTGLGSALFVDGRLVPNLEMGHHPFRDGDTYEELVGEASMDDIGKKAWRRLVLEMIDELQALFNYRLLHLGGGNARKLNVELPANVRPFVNVEGMTGGVRLWDTP